MLDKYVKLLLEGKNEEAKEVLKDFKASEE